MTGIADAYFGSIPTIFITGQVNTYEYKYDKPIRQQGFQETDVISIVSPITKYAVMVTDALRLRYELEKAFYIANIGRKGPVLIDLPMDISRAEVDPSLLQSFYPKPEKPVSIDWPVIKNTLQTGHRPLILIGGGCRDCKKDLQTFLDTLHIPYVTSLMGKGLVDEESPLYCGMIGSYGNRYSNIIISQCDVLLALGSRLDTRQTGAKIADFLQSGRIIHVDIDCNELKYHRLTNRINVNCDVKRFIEDFQQAYINVTPSSQWIAWIEKIKENYNQEKEVARFVENKAPYEFFEIFNKVSEPDSIITTDIGQNQMWAAQSIVLKSKQEFFTSGGLAPMGFSLPAAIG
ncbi:MAG: thiamine pyrophosphate-binding protein, partial [Allobaculum sp.]|nr:thiamine pyrophosphate-binding protein [Allobaculum sp.]